MTARLAHSSSLRTRRRATRSPRTGTKSGRIPTALWYAPSPNLSAADPTQQLITQTHTQLTYLAQCPGSTCTGVNAQTLSWFKIDEAGLLNGTIGDGYWGAGKMIDQNSSWTTTIPSTVPSGNYLIRFETIALHSLPAQIYPECAQINISGGGSRQPTTDELVKFPGGYSSTDPGRAWFLLLMCIGWIYRADGCIQ